MASAAIDQGPARRVRARVEGVVQGVGFRPHVHRMAHELELNGHVLNDARGVLVEVEGPANAVARFLERLATETPPLASVERVRTTELEVLGSRGFEILASRRGGKPEALVSPDTAICAQCLLEMRDPADRRYRYPFINCTNCGPRFTIARGVPYDRPLTTMAGFEMCRPCRAEYEDPGDRRFHAQPNACPDCGPAAQLLAGGGDRHERWAAGQDPIEAAAQVLRAGLLLAVKGLGGYHLACRARDAAAVSQLRARKHREDRPFALMAPDLATAEGLVELGEAERALLLDRSRPIVLARRRAEADVATEVAPRSVDLGVMLPYSPLHELLLADVGEPLVLTSGNLSDEPIAYEDEDALARLAPIADAFLVHDRPIHMRTDDSVVRATARAPLLIRRSRGYVPASIDLPLETPRGLLACGAELKSTFCVAQGRRAWVGHHIGDLKNWETLSSFRTGVEHFERLFSVVPEVIAHDLHPDYLSTAYALERENVETLGVQHHHAHLAACLAEHGRSGPAVGAIFDGSGAGTDGTVWGGELLVGDLRGFERAGHLRAVRLPGGDRAVHEPWRMAAAWLEAARPGAGLPARLLGGELSVERWATMTRLARSDLAPPTTSMGRLFDAVAALCGLRASVSFEGQAAVELEGAVDLRERGAYAIALGESTDGTLELDPREALLAIEAELESGAAVSAVAARFHRAVAEVTAAACATIADRRGLSVVVLSGGVFQNRVLLEGTAEALAGRGLDVLVPVRLPPNDGGIAYGQVAVAAAVSAAPPVG